MVTTKGPTAARKVAKKTRRAGPAPTAAPTKPDVPGVDAPAALPVVPATDEHVAKQKLVRDSFTIPKAEYDALGALKVRLVALARPTRKSELLRAGIRALGDLTDQALVDAVGRIETLKTGRPKAAAKKADKPSKKKR